MSRFCEREKAEWQAADVIVCGSAFVRDGIRETGGPWDRCRIVPYAYEPAERPAPRVRRSGPLRVLTVGAFSLRKGTPYVIEAARRTAGSARFRLVGQISAPLPVVRDAARHVEVVGPVPRSAVFAHYAWADVFLLPSICEGSATATYEALAWGLPVICTVNTGSIVRDGVDGFIVGRGDPAAIAGRIDALGRDPDLLERMSAAASETMRDFTMARYADRLFESVFAQPGRSGAGENRQ